MPPAQIYAPEPCVVALIFAPIPGFVDSEIEGLHPTPEVD